MKKYILGFFVVSFSFMFCELALAQNLTDGDTSNDVCISLQTSLLRYRSADATSNGEVSIVQDFLIDKGLLSGTPTGFYGRLTVTAVKNYQRSLGISPTGNVGSLTKSLLQKETCTTSGDVSINPNNTYNPKPTSPSNPTGCTSSSGFNAVTGMSCAAPATGIVCTMEYRFCPDGSGMPRENCAWRADKCPVSNIVPSVVPSVTSAYVANNKIYFMGTNIKNLGTDTYVAYKIDCVPGETCSGSLTSLSEVTSNYISFNLDQYLSSYTGDILVQIYQKAGGSISPRFTVTATSPLSAPVITSAKVDTQSVANEKILRVYGKNLTDTVYVGTCGAYYTVKGSKEEMHFYVTKAFPACIQEGKDFPIYMMSSGGVKSNIFYPQNVTAQGASVTLSNPAGMTRPITLQLKYDSVGKESVLVGTMGLTIKAGSNGLSYNLNRGVPLYLGLSNANSGDFLTTNGTKFEGGESGGMMSYEQGVKTLKPGETVEYVVRMTTPTKELVAGTYSVSNYAFFDTNNTTLVSKNSSNSNSVTILGETSPYIVSTYSDPGSKNPNSYIIQGVRFSPTSNSVSINGITKVLPSSPSYSTNGSVMGASVSFNSSDFGITTSGSYVVTIATENGLSNRVSFLATPQPTISASPSSLEFLNSPSVSLQYDNAGKESVLVGTAKVKVTAGSNGLSYYVYNGLPNIVSLPYTNSYKIESGITGDIVNNETGVHTLSAGQSAYYSIKVSVPTKELFAGTYSIVTADLSDSSGTVIPKSSFKGPSSSNAVTIIGETSPYITSAQCTFNVGCTISGVRFDQTYNTVTGGTVATVASSLSSGTRINFKLSDLGIAQVGTYSLQISSPNGVSNRVALVVSFENLALEKGGNNFGTILSSVNGSLLEGAKRVVGTFSQTVPVFAASCVNLESSLHRGKESPSVTKLQDFLIKKGFLSEKASGFFGDMTISAVKAYQKSLGIKETGMVYDTTRLAIKEETCGGSGQ